MKKNALTESGLFHVRALTACALCGMALFFGALSLSASPKARTTSPPPVNWSVVHSADMGPQDLLGISCPSTSDCWTVGYYTTLTNIRQTLARHWDGIAWTTVPTPNVTNTDGNSLLDVACVTANDCWAVGRRAVADTNESYTLTEHWNGMVWSVVPSADPGPSSRLLSVTCITTTDCWAVGYNSNNTLIEHWDGNSWSIAPSPNVGTSNRLSDVACTSASSCWAAGYYSSGGVQQTLIEQWNGVSWSVAGSANTSPSEYNALFALTCNTNTDCWAVGTHFGNTPDATLTEHWDGNSWTIVPSPNAPTDASQLVGITCTSSIDCWAVGTNYTAAYEIRERTMIQHWDGTSWLMVTAPHAIAAGSSDILLDVACPSASQCWAVGEINLNTPFIAQWNGASWASTPTERIDGSGVDNYLFDTTCVSSTDCWAVGFNGTIYGISGTVPDQTLIQHWNGSAWLVIPSPNTDREHNYLHGVTCVSTSDCWAVGDALFENDFDHTTLVEHWNGSAWSIVDSPNPSFDNTLQKVTCTSTSDCWAVGFYYDDNETAQTLIQHWNGAAWVVVPSPEGSASGDDFLYDVACTSASDCWAVGYYFAGATGHALFEHWNGSNWSVVAPPDPGAGNSALLQSVACISATDCWAVGTGATPSGQRTLFEHWNGASWTIVASPTISLSAPVLNAVSCSSGTECWATGSYFDPQNDRQPLVTRWDGNEWSNFSSPITNSQNSSQLRGVTCTSASHCWAVGDYQSLITGLNQTLIEALTPIPPLTSVTSRKTHGAGSFDVNLPGTGTGIECRSGGASGDYTVVFTFENALTSVDAASVTNGTGTVSGSAVGADPHEYVVNLTGVTNAQHLTISLSSARDSAGNIGNSIFAGFNLLIGDTNGDGSVNSADISQTKSQSGQDLTNGNFREDLNADGAINSADISLVKSKSGSALPSQVSRAAHSNR